MWQNKRNPRLKQLEFFIADLGDLLAGGIDLDQALAALSVIAPRRYAHAKSMQVAIRRGVAVDEVFTNAAFPEVAIAFIRIGLVTGELEQSLQNLSAYLGSRRKRRDKFGKLIAYPLFLTVLSTASLYMMAWQVIPHFLSFYHALNLQIPFAVQWVLQSAHVLVVALPYVILLLLCVATPLWWTRTRWLPFAEKRMVKQKWGGWLRLIKAAQSFETLAALLSAGIDMITSLQVLISTNTARMQVEWGLILHAIEQGEPLSMALKHTSYLPELASIMLSVAEQTGDLESAATRLKRYYASTLERTLERFFALFEPASLLVLGLIVGGVTVILLLPMTDLVRQLS